MANYTIDPLHSEIEFKVKHMMISSVRGRFNTFQATMNADSPDFSDAIVDFTADIESINTGVADRDNHLKSKDFFDAAQFPHLTFKASGMEKFEKHSAMTGDLTIRGVSKPVTLNVIFNGSDKDPWGNEKYGFEMTGSLSRKEFGLDFNMLSGAGNALVGDQIDLIISVQMMRQ
jgi:polyisoprenoid-binding protein YceI